MKCFLMLIMFLLCLLLSHVTCINKVLLKCYSQRHRNGGARGHPPAPNTSEAPTHRINGSLFSPYAAAHHTPYSRTQQQQPPCHHPIHAAYSQTKSPQAAIPTAALTHPTMEHPPRTSKLRPHPAQPKKAPLPLVTVVLQFYIIYELYRAVIQQP